MTARSGASAALVAATLLFLAGPASAQDRATLTPRIEFSQEYDDNAFDLPAERSDLKTVIEPRIDFDMEGETGFARVGVGARQTKYWRYDELDTFDPYAQFAVDRRLSQRFGIDAQGAFRDRDETDRVGDGDFIVRDGRASVRERTGGFGFRYMLSPVDQFRLGTQVGDYDFDDPPLLVPQQDYRFNALTASYTRTLTPRDSVGLTLRRQNFAIDGVQLRSLTTPDLDDRRDEITSASANWRRQWTPQVTTDVSLGARYLDPDGGGFVGVRVHTGPDRSTPLVALLPENDSSTGIIGSMSIERRGFLSSGRFSYTRETRPQSGSSGSLDVDRILATYSRRIGSRFVVSLTGRIERSVSASESRRVRVRGVARCLNEGGALANLNGFEGFCLLDEDAALDQTLMGVAVNLTWRIRRDLFTFLSYDYQDSEFDRSIGNSSSYDNHRVRVGVRYEYQIDLF